jgi:hypothetical protein
MIPAIAPGFTLFVCENTNVANRPATARHAVR